MLRFLKKYRVFLCMFSVSMVLAPETDFFEGYVNQTRSLKGKRQELGSRIELLEKFLQDRIESHKKVAGCYGEELFRAMISGDLSKMQSRWDLAAVRAQYGKMSDSLIRLTLEGLSLPFLARELEEIEERYLFLCGYDLLKEEVEAEIESIRAGIEELCAQDQDLSPTVMRAVAVPLPPISLLTVDSRVAMVKNFLCTGRISQ